MNPFKVFPVCSAAKPPNLEPQTQPRTLATRPHITHSGGVELALIPRTPNSALLTPHPSAPHPHPETSRGPWQGYRTSASDQPTPPFLLIISPTPIHLSYASSINLLCNVLIFHIRSSSASDQPNPPFLLFVSYSFLPLLFIYPIHFEYIYYALC